MACLFSETLGLVTSALLNATQTTETFDARDIQLVSLVIRRILTARDITLEKIHVTEIFGAINNLLGANTADLSEAEQLYGASSR